ncbi:MAG: hypothetical protein CM15mP74_07120 [Halieaceae bacterium]|nr:MAG: hypothetical protein CM15mP74_07120 [Halieaceae bacterium]
MITVLRNVGLSLGLVLAVLAQSVSAEDLRIIGEDKSFITTLPSGESVTITRQMTPCAKNKGWLQPLVPEPGIVPVTEIEVLNAIGDPNTILVDMRTEEWFLDATIPGSVNIPTPKSRCGWMSWDAIKVMRVGIAVMPPTSLGSATAPCAPRVLRPCGR